MVKRRQSRAQDLRNKVSRGFLKAFKDNDQEGIKLGYQKGFRVPNTVFIDQLAKQINNVLNRNMIQTINFDSYKLLNPKNINVRHNGYTLLDVITKLFSDAIDMMEVESGKKYFLNSYEFFVDKLIQMGAVLNHEPIYPTTIRMNTQLAKIINTLETVNPYATDEEATDEEATDEE